MAKFVKMTRDNVRKLITGKPIAEHGIVVQRTKKGDLRYSINVMVDGERIHRVIGTDSEGVTREQAERAIEQFRTQAREGRLNLPAGRKLHLSFAEAAKGYLERMEQTGGRNLKSKTRHINAHLVPAFGSVRADRLTDFQVQQYTRKRLEVVKQPTVNRELATLSHALKRFVQWKWIKHDDAPRIVKGLEPRKKIAVLDEQHATALMEAAKVDSDSRLWLFVAFGLNAAMRHAEILRVRYDHIDFANCRIFIPDAKAGEREQPITSSLANHLRSQLAVDGESADWVFPSVGKTARQPHRTSLAVPFKRAVIRAGLLPGKVTPHVMRHTAITRLVKAGVDLPTVQKISGHKTLAMVLRYAHVHGRHIDQAIAVLDANERSTATPVLHAA
ncbi:site-specific integrase [Sphingomonas sp. NBWT7]|uniref:tyrosine-type recombinase/integrase n=1 Tax=Sphingomonas sp. NBWT7 TaxID=2596913 RepID=UPI001625EE8F|nr:site-specific integrase [Sphingomonas sp. NBWT7]